MSMLSDDLAAIFADTAVMVSVSFGMAPSVQETTGNFATEDVPTEDGMGGVVIDSRRTVTIADGALTGLADDLPITVSGVVYTIHGVRSAGRGKTKLILA